MIIVLDFGPFVGIRLAGRSSKAGCVPESHDLASLDPIGPSGVGGPQLWKLARLSKQIVCVGGDDECYQSHRQGEKRRRGGAS